MTRGWVPARLNRWLLHHFGINARREPLACESSAGAGEVVLPDDSTWCIGCHCSAHTAGYDAEPGRIIR